MSWFRRTLRVLGDQGIRIWGLGNQGIRIWRSGDLEIRDKTRSPNPPISESQFPNIPIPKSRYPDTLIPSGVSFNYFLFLFLAFTATLGPGARVAVAADYTATQTSDVAAQVTADTLAGDTCSSSFCSIGGTFAAELTQPSTTNTAVSGRGRETMGLEVFYEV